MISWPGQRATGPTERGGAPGAGPPGTAPGTGLGVRRSPGPVPGPRHQAPQRWAPGPAGRCPGRRPRPGTSPWEGDPGRPAHPSPFRPSQPGASGRKGLGGKSRLCRGRSHALGPGPEGRAAEAFEAPGTLFQSGPLFRSEGYPSLGASARSAAAVPAFRLPALQTWALPSDTVIRSRSCHD